LIAICAVPPFHETVTVPPRAEVVAFEATVIVRVAVSLPDDAPEKVTQLAFDDAAQVQLPDVLVSVTLKFPPADVGDCDVDESVYEHVVGVVGAVGVDSFLLQAETRRTATSIDAQQSFMGCRAANPMPRLFLAN
jgi:hypothetical protein